MPKQERQIVQPFSEMDDETGIKHLEARHTDQLGGMRFRPEPDRAAQGLERRFRGGKYPWELYHARLHRDPAADFDHTHEEAE